MSFSTSTMVPTSISKAINFLTRPLILSQEPDMIHSLRMILRSTLQVAYFAAHVPRLVLPLSSSSLPPRPIYAACIASGIQWQEWIALLGSRDFDLIIEPQNVSLTYVGPKPQTIIVWSEPLLSPAKRPIVSRLNFHDPQVPISKLGQQSLMQASLKTTLGSAQTRTNTRTLAQQLLETDHKQEADEIFAMISKTAIISPTPTREKFFIDIPMNTFPSPLSSPEVCSPTSSRPSSRSSTFSSLSFSDTESMTSASSTTSDFVNPARAQNKTTFVPSPTRIFISNEKKDVTKYLYQGGVSTVLTGGVMLGEPTTAKNPPAKHTNKNTLANSWRRSTRV